MFFVLSKALAFAAAPSTLLFVLAVLGLALAATRFRLAGWRTDVATDHAAATVFGIHEEQGVAGEDGVAAWCVVVFPVDDPAEEPA